VESGIFGARVRRIEDEALLRGRGRFVDDIRLSDMLHAAFLRSPYAHALIRNIDATAALAAPGVHAVWRCADIERLVPSSLMPPGTWSPAMRFRTPTHALARDETCHVGEAVAVVFASDRYRAEDAASLIAVEYEPLPVSGDCRRALEPGAPRAWHAAPDNLLADFRVAFGDCEAAFAGAPHVFAETFFQHKGVSHPMEGRGIVARFDEAEDRVTAFLSTQAPHAARGKLVEFLGCAEAQIRLVNPDVGGGFGPKALFYPEDVVVALAARTFRRPVKWVEDRREHFTGTSQERDQHWIMEIAADAEGRILGLRGTLVHDHGAFTPGAINLPQNSAMSVLGPYAVSNFDLRVQVILTNKVPASPVRGAGRPQAAFVMERMIDRVARELGIDRVELRRRNLIPPERMPYSLPLTNRDGSTVTYDSGDYPEAMDAALRAIDWAGFAERQAAARREGRHLGIGIAGYVEATGRGPFESGLVRIGPSGRIVVHTGASPQGQGTKTTLAQLCAAQLGAAVGDIVVVTGDTAAIPLGLGAYASRQAVTAGSSVHLAAVAVREKALGIAAHLLEAAKEDLEIADGRVFVRGVPKMSVTLAQIANAVAGTPGYALPPGMAPGLEATSNWMPQALTYCNGCAAAEVEVDVETGAVTIRRYVAVHDSGRLINPMIVDGQILGATAHGIGSALFEWMKYDDNGQPLTTTLAEYLLPTAPEIPPIDIVHRASPTPLNPIGVKGAGEGGTIPAPAAIISAVEDALAPFGVRISESPITPDRLVALIATARDTEDRTRKGV
jgi:carbon-monoxide dehydrogenase large subunit